MPAGVDTRSMDDIPPGARRRDPRAIALGDLYPFDSHHLDVGGQRLHYVDEGDGPPVLMLHGNPSWSFYYRDLIRGLRDRFRVIAPDHIGCGLSDKPQDYPYTLASHMDNVDRLADHLGLSDVTLAVHDWGGAIGFGWATRHAGRVRRFIVFNTAAFLGGRTPVRIRVCRWPLLGELLVRGLNGFARAATHMATRRVGGMSRAVRRGYLLPYDSYAHRVAVLRFVRDIPLGPADPSHAVVRAIQSGLPRLMDRPMLICWGMKDFCFTGRFLDEWIVRFPNAEVHRFEDAGHYVVEDAHERILPIMERFLD
jgi:haloalkane dehalogenase